MDNNRRSLSALAVFVLVAIVLLHLLLCDSPEAESTITSTLADALSNATNASRVEGRLLKNVDLMHDDSQWIDVTSFKSLFIHTLFPARVLRRPPRMMAPVAELRFWGHTDSPLIVDVQWVGNGPAMFTLNGNNTALTRSRPQFLIDGLDAADEGGLITLLIKARIDGKQMPNDERQLRRSVLGE